MLYSIKYYCYDDVPVRCTDEFGGNEFVETISLCFTFTDSSMSTGFDRRMSRLEFLCYTMLPRLRAIGPYVGLAVFEDQSWNCPTFIIILMGMNIFPALIKICMSISDINLVVTIMVSISSFIMSFGCVILTVVNKKNFVKLLDEVSRVASQYIFNIKQQRTVIDFLQLECNFKRTD